MRRFFAAILIVSALCGSAAAATSRRLPVSYVEYTVGAGGNFATMTAAEDATDNNLVTATQGVVLTLLPGTYNEKTTFSGATVNASYFRVLRCAPGGERAATINYSGSGTDAIILRESYFGLYDINVRYSGTFINPGAVALGGAGNVAMRVVGVWASGASLPPGGRVYGIDASTEGAVYIINCYISDLSAQGEVLGISYYLGPAYIYNCLIDGADYAIFSISDTIAYLKNTIVRNCAELTSEPTLLAQTTNIVSTDSGTVTFATPPMLADGSSAIDVGTDLSSDAVFASDDDYYGKTRTGAWDVGPAEWFWARHGYPWALGPWDSGPWTGGGKMGRWN